MNIYELRRLIRRQYGKYWDWEDIDKVKEDIEENIRERHRRAYQSMMLNDNSTNGNVLSYTINMP